MTDPVNVVRTLVEDVWNGGRLERLSDLHPPEFVNEGEPMTPEGAAEWHQKQRETFPDVHYVIDELVAAGDRVVVRWTAKGTQDGALWGVVPPSSRSVSWRGMHLLTVRSGRIVEVWAVADQAAVPRQLGVKLVAPS